MLVLFLIVISIIVIYNTPRRLYFRAMFLMFLMPCSIYFFWLPNEEADLHWHYRFWSDVSYLSFSDIVSMDFHNIYTISSIYTEKFIIQCPVFSLIVWGISLLGIKELEPFIIIGSTYFFIVYVLRDISNSIRYLDKPILFVCFLFSICVINLLGLSGLRNPLAFSLFALISYFDFVKKKKILYCLFLYCIFCLIHPACFMLLAFRLVFILVGTTTLWIPCLLVPLVVSFLPQIIMFFGSLGGLMENVVDTGQSYFISGSSVVDGYNRIFTLVLYLFILYVCIKTKRISDKFASLCNFMIMILFFAVFNIANYDVFVRFIYYLVPLTTLLFTEYGSVKKIKNKNLFSSILLISIFALFYYVIRQYYYFDM